ncbi:hypothetical protein V8E55_008781 [Tylopilus felleus]
MDTIDLPRECTISIPTETESFSVGFLKGTLGIPSPKLQDQKKTANWTGLRLDEESPRKFVLDKVGNDEYNILIDKQSVDEKENGELCLTSPVVGRPLKKWKIVMVSSPEVDATRRYM